MDAHPASPSTSPRPPLYRPLEAWCLVDLDGDDALSWLHGQITNSLKVLERGESVYALVTNTKGKILSELWVSRSESSVHLALPKLAYEGVSAHFESFIVMEDVELQPRPDFGLVHLWGEGSADYAQEAVVTLGEGLALPLPRLSEEGWDLWLPQKRLDELETWLSSRASGLGHEAWESLRIARGVPQFGIDFDSRHFPQEAGLKSRGVSFTKGCYLGQEAIVMLEHRGKLPRTLMRLEIEGESPPPAGELLCNAEAQPVGEITSSARHPQQRERCVALARLELKKWQPGQALTLAGREVRSVEALDPA